MQKRIKEIFSRFSYINEFVEKENTKNIDYDYYIHLLSLPFIFNTNLKTIPDKIPYLKANPALIEKFKEKMKTDKKSWNLLAGKSKICL